MTIDKVLTKGFWMVKLPSQLLLALPFGSYILLGSYGVIPRELAEAPHMFFAVISCSFIGSWLVWSIQVPKWRLWAYSQVDSISELKIAATANQLIWREGSIFQKTEIATRRVWNEIERLERSKNGSS